MKRWIHLRWNDRKKFIFLPSESSFVQWLLKDIPSWEKNQQPQVLNQTFFLHQVQSFASLVEGYPHLQILFVDDASALDADPQNRDLIHAILTEFKFKFSPRARLLAILEQYHQPVPASDQANDHVVYEDYSM